MIIGHSGLDDVKSNLLFEQFGEQFSFREFFSEACAHSALKNGDIHACVFLKKGELLRVMTFTRSHDFWCPVQLLSLLEALRTAKEEKIFKIGSLFFEMKNRHLFSPKREQIALSKTEADILFFLLDQPGYAATKEALLRSVLRYDILCQTHTLETHIYNLRKKLEEATQNKKILQHDGQKYILTDIKIF